MINSHDEYLDFVIKLAERLDMFAYEISPNIHELGSESIPYFRLIYAPDRSAACISFHISTLNTVAIQYYAVAIGMCNNLILADSYYTSFAGEMFVGEDASIAQQMDVESQYVETTTTHPIDESQAPATFISQMPIYHALDPKAWEQKEMLKKRKTGMGR